MQLDIATLSNSQAVKQDTISAAVDLPTIFGNAETGG